MERHIDLEEIYDDNLLVKRLFSYDADECKVVPNDMFNLDFLEEGLHNVEDSVNPFEESVILLGDPCVELENSKVSDLTEKVVAPFDFSMCCTMDEQLDFIMATTKRSKKQKEINQKRSRKTPEQILTLEKELGGLKNASRSKIRTVATKAGLTTMQVYKWFWDRRFKY